MTDFVTEAIGPGHHRTRIDRGWWVGRGPNGGYIAALIVRAMEAELAAPERQLRSLTVHYLRVPPEGEVDVQVTIERSGRALSTVSARMLDGDKLLALAVAAFSSEYPSAVDFDEAPMPDVTPPETMPPPREGPMPIAGRWRMRGALGRDGRAHTGGWMAPATEQPVDAAVIVAMTDAWIPAPFVITGKPFAAPTIDLTVHIRAPLPRPADEPVLGEFTSTLSQGGFFEEDGRLWAPDGTLLAQSRQLALAL
jgi:acyl-CoA thioesterase